LSSPWSLEMHTMWDPCFTSSTNLGKKIPHFKIFLVLSYINQLALSHWYSYRLDECTNEWLNGSLLIWTIALKCGPNLLIYEPQVYGINEAFRKNQLP
jgi:hypothetical protein